MEVLSPSPPVSRRALPLTVTVVILLSCFRLAHLHLLWADEDYHLAASINILHGRVPYRDFWYDKPPLTALYYLLIGGWSGWALRLLDAAYIVACCAVAWRLASAWWGRREGYVAALLLAFFTTFYLPSAVIPFAADAVMLLPHLLAIYFAFHARNVIGAGILAGIAFLGNTKALFVLASCCLFVGWQTPMLLLAFGATVSLEAAALLALGAWPGYVEQVWHWGLLYAKGAPVAHPLLNGIARTGNWLGFHLALLLGSIFAFSKPLRHRWQLLGWMALSFGGVALGSRFAPHYFLQLLPPLVIAASRGITLAWDRSGRIAAPALILCLTLPVVRFGPHYLLLAAGKSSNWADIAMDLDSQRAAAKINAASHPGDTLLVWGYRPDIYVDTRLVSDSRFWDSQPLTGVPADRHLSSVQAIYADAAKANRLELSRTHPTWIVDGLSPFNPRLSIESYPELREWFNHYELTDRTALTRLYKRRF